MNSLSSCELWLELGVKPVKWVDESDQMNNTIRREPELHQGFSLEKAVCNHGFFMMAPNVWNPSAKTLSRPLRLLSDSDSDSDSYSYSYSDCSQSVYVTISQRELSRYLVVGSSRNGNNMTVSFLHVHVHDTCSLSLDNREYILKQVVRMLKLSEKDEENVMEFQKLHPKANQIGFGRLFRSPTIFEDAVKSILLCNCTWSRALQMAEALCGLSRPSRRKSRTNRKSLPDFPIPEELADLTESSLKQRCNLGYRAFPILDLAREIAYGDLSIDVEEKEESCDEWYEKLMQLNGFGPFVCANVLMCMGFYSHVPVDTETHRHLSEYHSIDPTLAKASSINILENIYGKYSPFQCLAYWLELVEYYEKELGMKLSELPNSKYGSVTGTLMGNKLTSSGESMTLAKVKKKWKFSRKKKQIRKRK